MNAKVRYRRRRRLQGSQSPMVERYSPWLGCYVRVALKESLTKPSRLWQAVLP